MAAQILHTEKFILESYKNLNMMQTAIPEHQRALEKLWDELQAKKAECTETRLSLQEQYNRTKKPLPRAIVLNKT